MPTEANPAPVGGTERPRRDPFTLFLVVACIALAVLVIFMARQNRHLKESAASFSAAQIPRDALKAGDRVDPFELIGEANRRERLEFAADGPKTLLLVFSTHCPACEKTLPLWSDFLAAGPPAGVRAIGIQTDRPGASPDLGDIVPASLHFPVFSVDKPGSSALDRIPYVPSTVLLDGHGLVVRVWFGIPEKEQLAELRELLAP